MHILHSAVKAKIQVSGKCQEVLLHCIILGTIAALFSKNNVSIDMEKALEHPLTPAFMPLSSADDIGCKTTKIKLFIAALNDMETVQGTLPDSRTTLHYYLDIAASVRTFIQSCEAIRGLSKVRSSRLEVFSKKGVLKNFPNTVKRR